MRDVTDSTFATEVLAASKPVIVDFWAEWCPPCRALEPILQQLADAHPGLEIVKVNADENPAVAAEYRVTGLPSLKVFEGGELVKTILGAKPRAALEAELASIL
jgi:thioredoxin 1